MRDKEERVTLDARLLKRVLMDDGARPPTLFWCLSPGAPVLPHR